MRTLATSAFALALIFSGIVNAQDTPPPAQPTDQAQQSGDMATPPADTAQQPGMTGETPAEQQAGSEAVNDLKSSVNEMKSDCKADVEKLCKGIQPGEGRVAQCLGNNQDKVSQVCKDSIVQANAAAQTVVDKTDVAFRKECGSDVQKFCAETPSGGGRILDCLDDHQANLSSSCKGFQARVQQEIKKASS